MSYMHQKLAVYARGFSKKHSIPVHNALEIVNDILILSNTKEETKPKHTKNPYKKYRETP